MNQLETAGMLSRQATRIVVHELGNCAASFVDLFEVQLPSSNTTQIHKTIETLGKSQHCNSSRGSLEPTHDCIIFYFLLSLPRKPFEVVECNCNCYKAKHRMDE